MRIETPPSASDLTCTASKPVFIDWRWYYNFPALALWALIVVLLVVPKCNRQWQAWLILIPLGLLVGVWHLPTLSLFMAPSSIDNCHTVTEWSALPWSFVYLAAPWLAARSRFSAFFRILAVMFILGFISAYCLFSEVTADALPFEFVYCLSVFVLLLTMMLTSLACSEYFTARKFLVLLLVMILAVLMLMVSLWAVGIIITMPRELGSFLMALVPGSAIFGFVLYILNLPFLLLAFNSPFYRARFESLFRVGKDYNTEKLPETARRRPTIAPLSTVPTNNAVSASNIIGCWQFYLDSAVRTVLLEFRPDGTFAQTILFNRGGTQECPGGTWKLVGPIVHLTGYISAVEDADPARTWWIIDTSAGVAIYGGDGRDPHTFVCLQRCS